MAHRSGAQDPRGPGRKQESQGPARSPLWHGEHRRPRSPDAQGVRRDRQRGRHAGHRADHRRKRHRQVADRPRDSSPQLAPRQAVCRSRLRRPAGNPAGKRTVRPRGRLVHRRHRRQDRESSCRPTAARSFSTKSAPPARPCKSSCCACLQELEFEPVGGNKTYHVDTRVILATNEDLSKLVAEGRFRQDLFYRVNVINVELPPLRERISDIPLLAQHFLARGLRGVRQARARIQRRGDRRPAALLVAGQRPRTAKRDRAGRAAGQVRSRSGSTTCRARWPPPDPVDVEPIGTRTLKEALEGPERQIILEVLESNQLEPLCHGRSAGHQPHHAVQEDEAAGAGRTPVCRKGGITVSSAQAAHRRPILPTEHAGSGDLCGRRCRVADPPGHPPCRAA